VQGHSAARRPPPGAATAPNWIIRCKQLDRRSERKHLRGTRRVDETGVSTSEVVPLSKKGRRIEGYESTEQE